MLLNTSGVDQDNMSLYSGQEAGNSTASPESTTQCEESAFFFIVYGPLYGLVCAFGLVGNSLSFAVLHKYSRNSVATYLLKALAISDNAFLGTAALVQMFQAMTMHYGRTELLYAVYPHLQTFAWPIVHIVQMGTVWMMVLIASNRYIAVCKPLHAPRLCRKTNVQLQLLAMCLALILYNVPRFFEYEYATPNMTLSVNTSLPSEPVNVGLASLRLYNILYENVAYCLFVFLLPLCILIFFNVHLVWDLKKAQRSRKVSLKAGRTRSVEENNITLVMIIIIIVFIMCQTPASINQILFYIISTSATGGYCTSYFKFYHLCNLFILLNSSVNFIIYCVFRRQFQQELRALVCRAGRTSNAPPHTLRKTVLLRAMHERTSSTYIHTSGESQPLNHTDHKHTDHKHINHKHNNHSTDCCNNDNYNTVKSDTNCAS